MLNSKKSELLSLWWFVVLIFIGIGIVAGTFLFYSEKIDVRATQSEVIAAKILGCISQAGVLDSKIFKSDFDIFSFCSIDKKTFLNSGSYVLRILIKPEDSSKNLIQILGGNNGLVANCALGNSLQAKNYPRCIEKKLDFVDSQGNFFEVNILIGSNYEYNPN
jgi:hypothetical protein